VLVCQVPPTLGRLHGSLKSVNRFLHLRRCASRPHSAHRAPRVEVRKGMLLLSHALQTRQERGPMDGGGVGREEGTPPLHSTPVTTRVGNWTISAKQQPPGKNRRPVRNSGYEPVAAAQQQLLPSNHWPGIAKTAHGSVGPSLAVRLLTRGTGSLCSSVSGSWSPLVDAGIGPTRARNGALARVTDAPRRRPSTRPGRGCSRGLAFAR
jgi:hypothetical protein